jgi:hypothetical protein
VPVTGLLLVGAAVAAAVLLAAAARLGSPVSTVLAAYLALVANVGLTTLVLSPFGAVTRGGLAVAEAMWLAAALTAWWARGRPRLPLDPAAAALREVVRDPVTALFLACVLLLLGYELVLGLTVPPNNGDALGYHMAKAAAWAQEGGIHWIPDAPTVRMNAFQPLAEQELLFLFVAWGSGALFALPQFLAELAILVAVYGAARRLGFEVRPAACAAFLLATFSLLALEASTAQNDLVAASFPAVAVCLLLGRGGGRLEPALAGVAAGFGLGAKLTTALVLPILVWLAAAAGRRALAAALAGGVAGFVAVGMWGYVLNLANDGELLGADTSDVLNRASPSYPGSVANAFYLAYGTMDLTVLSDREIWLLALAGVVVAIGVAAWALRRTGRVRALGEAGQASLPFLAPLLALGTAGALAFVAREWDFPIRGAGGILEPVNANLNREYTRLAHESFSAFGPVGIVSLVAATVVAVVAYVRRRATVLHLALACALPSFLLAVSLTTRWNEFLVRFFVVPVVLAAPLLAFLFRSRAVTGAYVVTAGLVAGLTVTQQLSKPLESAYGFGPPWQLTQAESLSTNSRPDVAAGITAFEEVVPEHACVGAVLDVWEPSYLLYGPKLGRHVVYLPTDDAWAAATREGVGYAVLGGLYAPLAESFRSLGWEVQDLGGFWLLASRPDAATRRC